MTVDEVIGHYQRLGREVFTKDWFRKGVVRARYDEQTLITHLKRVFGKDLTLGDDSLGTGLLIVTKRLDTGSVWPVGNNPLGQFFRAKDSTRGLRTATTRCGRWSVRLQRLHRSSIPSRSRFRRKPGRRGYRS